MASVNKVTILGNCAKDAEVRYSPEGTAFANLTVATNRTWKDKNSGDKKEEAEFHRVSFFGRLAEIAGEYLSKGKPVYISGRLRTRKWQDKDGQDRYTTEIVAEEMQLLGGRDDGGRDQSPSKFPRPFWRGGGAVVPGIVHGEFGFPC